MGEEVYLVNPKTGSRHRLGGVKPSERPSNRPKFGAIRKYSDKQLPHSVDLRSNMTAVEDQEQLNSCVANAFAAAYEFLIKKNTGKDIDVCRLFIYYNSRLKQGLREDDMEDSGTPVPCAVEALQEYGCCKEELYPYDSAKVDQKPPPHCYSEAKQYRIVDGLELRSNINEMKACLAEGHPFVFALKTFPSLAEAETNGGRVLMPQPSESMNEQHGWHALLGVGYNDQLQNFTIKNSWGAKWGDHGYGYIPYDYMKNPEYCVDLYTIKVISGRSRGDAVPQPPDTFSPNYTYDTSTDISPNYTYEPGVDSYSEYQAEPYDDYSWYQTEPHDYYDDSYFWNQTNPYSYDINNWGTEQVDSALYGFGSAQKSSGAYIERIPRKTKARMSYILWIDNKSEDNFRIMKELTDDQHLQIDFCETFSMALHHIQQHIEKIKLPSSKFQIICRGYYKNENKNPLDLLLFLNHHHLKAIPVNVYTQDKQGLQNHLQTQAPTVGIYDWKNQLFITNNSKDLITKIKANINNLNKHPR